jgi:curved DNA-binding protein CbpA
MSQQGTTTAGSPVLYVTSEISSQAHRLILKGPGSSIRDGVELLLVNGVANLNESGSINAGLLLQRGLTYLSNSPYEALDINQNAEPSEVKKAYRRMALKYHPDKNPSTTPLFHVIHGAYEKLMDTNTERKNIPTKPSSATSPTKPKQTSSESSKSQQTNSSQSETFQQYQSKPNKSTSYRRPETPSSEKNQQFEPKMPKFDQQPKTTPSQWAYNRQGMAGDNDPLPGQNSYEGFRGYSQFPKEQNPPSGRTAPASQANATRRKSHSTTNLKSSSTATPRPEEDAKERASRRQKEHDQASKRIAERRARQQQRQNKEKDDIDGVPPPRTRTGSKSSTSKHFKEKQSSETFPLPIPSEVMISLDKDNATSVELNWKRYSSSKTLLLKVELSWRTPPPLIKQSNSSWKVGQSKGEEQLSSDWIVSSLFISSNTVRKKNLKGGTKYEFRVRYVLIKDEEICDYERGEWSETISITIPSTVTTSSSTPARVGDPPSECSRQPMKPSLSSLSSLCRNTIEITEIKAKGLHSRTLFGLSNPYVACTIGLVREKTAVISHTNDPDWGMREKLIFQNISLMSDSLHVEIFDKELISRKSLLGEISIPLSDLRYNEEIKNWMSLSGGSSEESDHVCQIYLSIRVRQTTGQDPKTIKEETDTGFLHSRSEATSSHSVLKYYQLNPPRPSARMMTTKAFLYPVFDSSSVEFRDLISAPVIGYLTPLKFVLVDEVAVEAEDLNWIRVQCHYSADDQLTLLKSPLLWGWCPRTQDDHSYFTLVSEEYQYEQSQSPRAQPSSQTETGASVSDDEEEDDEEEEGHDDDDGVPVWYQLRDESTGYYYYYNETTGESEWEPPEWVEEQDTISGSRYYAHLNAEDGSVLETTWSKPEYFVRLVREVSK